jgi:hypothetical protein
VRSALFAVGTFSSLFTMTTWENVSVTQLVVLTQVLRFVSFFNGSPRTSLDE